MAVAAVTVNTVMAVASFTVIESSSGHGPSMFHRRCPVKRQEFCAFRDASDVRDAIGRYRDRKVGSAHQCSTSCRSSCGIERKCLRELWHRTEAPSQVLLAEH
jgi:hypothetical protein